MPVPNELAWATGSFESRWVRRLAPWAIPIGVAIGVAIAAVGCHEGGGNAVERVSVTGQVTLDGRPLQAGAIVFHSVSGDPVSPQNDSPQNDQDPITAFSFVENGAYTIDAKNGPAIGVSRVEFRSKPIPREAFEDAIDQAVTSNKREPPPTNVVGIPDIYGVQSTLQVELVAGKNQKDFHLKSKP